MVVKTVKHRVDIIVSDKRNTVEVKSRVKQALNMDGYLDWVINSITTIQPL